MSNTNHYDVIIIGSGAGGGTLAHRLAPSGKSILILERGDFVPREKANWDPKLVNLEGKYQTKEHWYDAEGKPLHPHTNYYVGGNTKFYGAALFRLRKEDFGLLHHDGGLSPAWPISYDDLSPIISKPNVSSRCMASGARTQLSRTRPDRTPFLPSLTSLAFSNSATIWRASV